MAKKDFVLTKDSFEFVQMNEKIFDKKFDTKAIGYFGDALRRFAKNKSSVVAFIILMFIILMAIIMPAISSYDPRTIDPTFANLPPRIPLLEKLGIADGTREYDVNIEYIISLDDPIVEKLTAQADAVDPETQQSLYIDKYYFIEYVENYDSLEEAKASARATMFDGVITYKLRIKYNVYKSLSRPRWEKVEHKLYLELQKQGVIQIDENGNERSIIDYVGSENQLKKFLKKYEKDTGIKIDPIKDKEKAIELYYADPDYKDKVLETFNNYTVYLDYSENPLADNRYHFFGTDNSGRDVWTRLWKGTRLSLLIGLFVAVVSITVGVIWGSISGYYGGIVDLTMERFTEILTGIPWIVIMTITKMLLIGKVPNVFIVIISLILTSWTGTASMVRSQMYRYKNREYVLASRTLGAKDARLIFKHILPNALGTIVTSCVLVIPSAIFFESSVAYLGLGVDSTTISIGNILNAGRDAGIIEYPYLTLFPALLIAILMISFNMFGNGLRDALNPSLRGSE